MLKNETHGIIIKIKMFLNMLSKLVLCDRLHNVNTTGNPVKIRSSLTSTVSGKFPISQNADVYLKIVISFRWREIVSTGYWPML